MVAAEDRVLNRLIEALAAQVETSPTLTLAPEAVEALEGLSRAEANRIFGAAGHLVHYGAETRSLQRVIGLITDALRADAATTAGILPGDEVRLVGELSEALSRYDDRWLRETVFVVRYVGDDHTVDVQPDLSEEYILATVPVSSVRPAR